MCEMNQEVFLYRENRHLVYGLFKNLKKTVK